MAEVAELDEEHQEIEERWSEEIAPLKDENKSFTAREKEMWTVERATLKQNHNRDVAEAEAILVQEKDCRITDKAAFDKNFNRQPQAFRHNHRKDTQSLRKLVEKLEEDLVDRDRSLDMPDPVIAERFQELSAQVDQLARIPWDTNKKMTGWSYWESAFSRSDNVRILKRDILTNSVWIILDERIFHTPFNIFGEEGRILNRRWTDAFSSRKIPPPSDYGPKPTNLSESWRSCIMKECKQALEPGAKLTEGDNDRNHGYQTNLSSTAEEIARVVGKVALVQDDTMKKIHQIVKAAAEFWLDVGSQRFRILVKVPKLYENILSGGRTSESNMELIVKPGLQRIGNSEGEDFEKVETISGCEPQSNFLQTC